MVFFALLCYNDLSKNRKVDAKMDYQKWAQEVAQKIKIKELEVAKRNRGKIPYTAENGKNRLVDKWLLGRHDVATLQGNWRGNLP